MFCTSLGLFDTLPLGLDLSGSSSSCLSQKVPDNSCEKKDADSNQKREWWEVACNSIGVAVVAGLAAATVTVVATEKIDQLRPHSAIQKVVFQPPRSIYTSKDPHIYCFRPDTKDSLFYYHLPPPPLVEADLLKKKQRVIVYCHGNSGDLVSSSDFLKFLNNYLNHPGRSKDRWHVLSVEYCGYGLMNAEPLDEGLTIEKIATFLKEVVVGESGFCNRWTDLFLLGRSIGTGFVCAIQQHIQQPRIGGTILLSPFTRISDIVHDGCSTLNVPLLYPIFSLILHERFDNNKGVKFIENPLLIIHGDLDPLIPVSHARLLKKSRDDLSRSTTLIEIRGGSHEHLKLDSFPQIFLQWAEPMEKPVSY